MKTEKNYTNYIVSYIKDYDKFLNKTAFEIVRKCCKLEFEDVKQELILMLFINGKYFDENKNAAYGTYFSQIIMNASNNIVRKYWQSKNKANINCVSLDCVVKEDDPESSSFVSLLQSGEETNPESYYLKKELLDKVDVVKSTLLKKEKLILTMYMDGLSVEEISERLKRSNKSIYNTLNSIREKLKKII